MLRRDGGVNQPKEACGFQNYIRRKQMTEEEKLRADKVIASGEAMSLRLEQSRVLLEHAMDVMKAKDKEHPSPELQSAIRHGIEAGESLSYLVDVFDACLLMVRKESCI